MKINKPLSAALAAAGLGYAIGNLNPAYVMGLRKGYDIRKKGSGNAARRPARSSCALISARPR